MNGTANLLLNKIKEKADSLLSVCGNITGGATTFRKC